MSTAENLNVENDLVEKTETEEVDVIKLVVASLKDLGDAATARATSEKKIEEANKKEQDALERLYELTDEGDQHIVLPNATYRVRKKRGRATGYEFVEVKDSNTIDLSNLET